MNARQLLKQCSARLQAAGVPDPEVDASLLLSHITGRDALALRLDTFYEPDAETLARLEQLMLRRLAREPLQYLLGNQPFCGRSFRVDERVLIPRPETELLAEWAGAVLRTKGSGTAALDLCCGSGCLGVTLALDCPGAAVTAADLSTDALAVTRLNAEQLGARLTLRQGDLWQAVGGEEYDVIVSNPPYIPKADCRELQAEVLREPMMALDGGEDGLDFYRRIAEGAPLHLKPGGMLLLEVGIGEADAVRRLLEAAGMVQAEIREDWNGIARMVGAVWAAV